MAFKTLMSTGVLAMHLDETVVVDCRFKLDDVAWGEREYEAAHIPGAIYAHLDRDLSGAKTGTNGRHPLPNPDSLRHTFGRFGVTSGVQVVAYDQDNGIFASRLWWMLRFMGHDSAAVLDGGWAKWMREGRPIRTGEEARPAAVFAGRSREQFRVPVEDVEGRMGDPSVLLVDARSPERFQGSSEPLDRAPGHIPGAVNHFYQRNVTKDGVMLPGDQLRDQFAEVLGDRSPDQVVMYCGSGVTACQNLLAMEVAGLPGAKLYPGSWSDWSSNPERPVETGPTRRRQSGS